MEQAKSDGNARVAVERLLQVQVGLRLISVS